MEAGINLGGPYDSLTSEQSDIAIVWHSTVLHGYTATCLYSDLSVVCQSTV